MSPIRFCTGAKNFHEHKWLHQVTVQLTVNYAMTTDKAPTEAFYSASYFVTTKLNHLFSNNFINNISKYIRPYISSQNIV
jgi:hypothetical protein